MAENLLSQEEIDALFSKRKKAKGPKPADEGGEAAAGPAEGRSSMGGIKLPKGVILYDFHNPARLSKEAVQRMRIIHQSFLRTANLYFSVNLETQVEGSLTAMDQLTYREFLQSLPPVTCLASAQFHGHEGELMLEISGTLLFPLLNRLLGGSGDAGVPNREYSDIEISIAGRVFDDFLAHLARSWSPNEEEAFTAERLEIETSPRFVSAAAEGTSVIVAVCQIRIGNEEGSLSICYPHDLVVALLEATGFGADSSRHHSRRPEIGQSLGRVPVSVTVVLGETNVDLRSLRDLREGDVIRLDSDVTHPVDVYAGKIMVAQGRPGIRSDRRSVQVLRVSDSREGLA